MSDQLCPGCPGDPNENCCKPELRVKVWMEKQKASMSDQKTEQKHTPGEWVAAQGINQMSHPGTTVHHRDGWGVYSDADEHGCPEADSRLMSAAPNLLKAVKLFMAWELGQSTTGINRADVLDLGAAAIAKATGGAP